MSESQGQGACFVKQKSGSKGIYPVAASPQQCTVVIAQKVCARTQVNSERFRTDFGYGFAARLPDACSCIFKIGRVLNFQVCFVGSC